MLLVFGVLVVLLYSVAGAFVLWFLSRLDCDLSLTYLSRYGKRPGMSLPFCLFFLSLILLSYFQPTCQARCSG